MFFKKNKEISRLKLLAEQQQNTITFLHGLVDRYETGIMENDQIQLMRVEIDNLKANLLVAEQQLVSARETINHQSKYMCPLDIHTNKLINNKQKSSRRN